MHAVLKRLPIVAVVLLIVATTRMWPLPLYAVVAFTAAAVERAWVERELTQLRDQVAIRPAAAPAPIVARQDAMTWLVRHTPRWLLAVCVHVRPSAPSSPGRHESDLVARARTDYPAGRHTGEQPLVTATTAAPAAEAPWLDPIPQADWDAAHIQFFGDARMAAQS